MAMAEAVGAVLTATVKTDEVPEGVPPVEVTVAVSVMACPNDAVPLGDVLARTVVVALAALPTPWRIT
jgi:hypothetical protein